ncbi:MAG: putative photosynthetic complex assembly protein PuhE [Pseudomonadota bacterium]
MDIVLPLLGTAFLWWFSTVVALYLIGLPTTTYRATFLCATGLGVVGVFAVVMSSTTTSALSAFVAFAGALAIWSWHELSYYLGFVSGPEPRPCPPDCTRPERFLRGVRASLHHELAIVATAAILLVASWQAPNQVGLWTFCILWLMRWSAKLNIFLGVRNVHMDFLPSHLQYLSTFMTNRPMNVLFPFSLLVAGAVAGWLIGEVRAADASAFAVTAGVAMATLLVLAIFEHLLLVMKLPDGVLWRLGTASRRGMRALHE